MFKVYSKGMGYVVLTILILSIVGGGLRFAGVFGERVVFENSFQYKEGAKQRAAVLEAQILQLDVDIYNNPEMADSLRMQQKVLKAQLAAVK